jgi:hypothetical protein
MPQDIKEFSHKLIRLNEITVNDVFNPCNMHLSGIFPIQQNVIITFPFRFSFILQL